MCYVRRGDVEEAVGRREPLGPFTTELWYRKGAEE